MKFFFELKTWVIEVIFTKLKDPLNSIERIKRNAQYNLIGGREEGNY